MILYTKSNKNINRLSLIEKSKNKKSITVKKKSGETWSNVGKNVYL